MKTLIILTIAFFFIIGSCKKNETKPEKVELERISIKTIPGKTLYYITEILNLSGLEITMEYSDNSSKDVAFADFASNGITCSPTNGEELTVSASSVTITHVSSSKYTNQDITVSNTIKDVENNTYPILKIGTQLWMAENLKTTKYNNGDLIGTTNPPIEDITDETAPEYQWAYDGDENNVVTFGRLYTWNVAKDSRGICPVGWHVSSDDDWKKLEMALGMSQIDADNTGWRGLNEASKLAGNAALWADGSLKQDAAFGTSGFNALPGGGRRGLTNFYLKGYCAYWLTSTVNGGGFYGRSINCDDNRVYKTVYGIYGFSVRCVKD
jgi:uncharacterized protein (TIGR02145 family)